MIGLTGSLSLSYIWQMKKSYATQSQQSLYESYLQSNPISHIQSPPIPLLLSSQLLYDTRSLLTLLMSDTPFVLLVDSHFSTFIAILQNLQESLQTQISINKQVESQLDSLLQSLQKGNDLVYYYKHTKNDDLAQTQCKDMIKNNLYPYNPYYFAHAQENESTQIYKEAYTRVHAYIDNIPHNTSNKQAKHKKETLPSFTHLINKQLIQTKLQYQKIQDNKKYQSIGETTHTQKDFVIQLKRVAEYSYRVYKGERVLQIEESVGGKSKQYPIQESILSNLIYNPSFIPTKIDIHKEL